MASKPAPTLSVVNAEAAPPPLAKRYRCKLDTLSDCRREMGRVYRECRSGLVETSDASRLTYIISSIAKVIESSDLEARIQKLEEQRQ